MNRLYLTFEGQHVGESGLPVDAFAHALTGMQDAMRLMVEHLGGRQPGPGQPPRWVREQSSLQLTTVRPGSLVVELTVAAPDRQLPLENYAEQAVKAIYGWDGSQDSTLPPAVTDRLCDIPSALPADVRLWLGSADMLRRTEIKRSSVTARSVSQSEEALLQGWLREVNWYRGTAQLYDYTGSYVRLRFSEEHAQDMQRLATQFVEVRGRGQFDPKGNWTNVTVEQIASTRSWREPFDMDEFLNEPDPKIFDPDNLVTASEPFDVDEFVRIIHAGRDEGRKESSD